jgi:arabinogalactan endo-1,4-beta-galactosidase
MKKRIASFVITIIIISMVFACAPVQSPTKPVSTPTLIPTSAPTLAPTATAVSTSRPMPTVPSEAEFHVNPIDGLNPDFIMGADVSMLSQIEQSGGKFYDQGVEGDSLEILQKHGVNWIRLRLWNDPTDQSGNPLGGGNNDLQRTIQVATKAKSLGLKFLLDFHYSDWWADPSKQNIPKAWVGLGHDELNQAVYDFTANAIQKLAEAGAMPDMVQIGNEVSSGMLWPAGKTWSEGGETVGGYDGFAELLSQGIKAVRDNDPNNADVQKRVAIAIHLADGGNNDLYHTVFDALTERNVDFDVIGLSYYSYWHGPLNRFVNNMKDISQKYKKDVVVLEAAYPYTTADADGYSNLAGEGVQDSGGFMPTVQGQATAIRDIMAAVAQVPNGRGLGIFYWEPEWIPVKDAGWATGQGNAWENQAMFDFNGNALPSLDVFNKVRSESGNVFIAPQALDISPVEVFVPLSEKPELPATVKVTFSDDAIREVAVQWDSYPPPLLDKVGNFKLNGKITGTDAYAVATVYTGSARNFAKNPGFENGAEPWIIAGSVDAVDISNEIQNVHSGDYALHYWADGAFEFTVSQTITGLENGTYTFSAWAQGGSGDKLQISASDYGGDPLTVDFATTAWRDWKNPTIENIMVTNGQCTITLKVISPGGTWGFFDDAGLFLAQAK